MTQEDKSYRVPFRAKVRSVIFDAPWNLAAGIGKRLYDFHVEGQENIPEERPFIVWISEPGLIGMLLSGYIALVMLHKELAVNPENTVVYMQEELWALEYFRKALGPGSRGKSRTRPGRSPWACSTDTAVCSTRAS
jgi:hypothetical protein